MTAPADVELRCRCGRLLAVRAGGAVELRRHGVLVARFERGELACGRCDDVVRVEPEPRLHAMRVAAAPQALVTQLERP